MKITKLEIKGFKTFPDKTDLEFKPGITAVVGPNGCGKSNVLEAIRWVMGEQRVRSLRSKKMEDVIFNGSESRKPVGMAEVRMVLSNDDDLAPSYMADYDHIMITRRLFRDGESQYEINNVPCRLSDVTDFFLDTGVGRNSYAIIEQGRVDMVVAAKPEDRRVFIEEAAGIARYKSRKEAALKKLEQTRQNLLRISDLIAEVKRQGNALKRQASRAEQYVKLTEQAREMDIGLHAYRCRHIQEQLRGIAEKLQANQTVLGEKQARLSTVQADLERTRLSALQTEKELQELQEARHAVELELASVRNRMEADRSAVVRLGEREQHLKEEQGNLESRVAEAKLGLERVNEEKAKIQGELTEAAQALDADIAAAKENEQDLASKRTRLDRLKDDLFSVLQETSQHRNARETFGKKNADLAHGVERIERDAEHIRHRLQGDESERDEIRRAISDTETSLREAAQHREELTRTKARTAQQVADRRKDVAAAEKRVAGERARLESLREMQREYRAYDRSVQFLMKQHDSEGTGALLGPVAEIMEVRPEFQKALTALLGERLGHVVVHSPRDAVAATDKLKEASAGRTTFIPLLPRNHENGKTADALDGLTRLQDVVTFREGFEHVGDFLLRGSYVVDNLDTAVQVWEQNGIHVDLVTAAGDVLNRYGEITGGSLDDRGEEVFEKRREIAALEEKVSAAETDLDVMRASLSSAEESLEQIGNEIEEVGKAINDLRVKEVRIRKDRERLDSQIHGSRRRLEVLGLESQRVQKEAEGLAGRIQETEKKLATLVEKKERLEKERSDLQVAAEELSVTVKERSQKTDKLRVRLAHLEERNRSLDRECRAASDAANQLERQLTRVIDEAQRNTSEQERLTAEIDAGAVREKELMRTHELQKGSVDKLRALSSELSSTIQSLEQDAGTLSKVVRELGDSVHALEVDSVRLEQTLSDLVEKILERHHVDPRTAPAPSEPPDEQRVADLREKIAAMGEVNLAARAESRQIQERLAFLVEQEEDLKKAVDSLYATINAINKTSRERFREAFDSVNEKFQEIFPFLFRGGEARLVLTNEDDLLETGVEIMARPPGKRIQNMDLLSGGEKALTAVGLIFSIFLIRPSPFCLLDEVDAPLDDQNLSRFNEMLRKLSDRTQFLIITHNKRSMQEADSLYGITMETAGVSRVVSVAFA